MDSTWLWIGTIGSLVGGSIYWYFFRNQQQEDIPIIIKPPTASSPIKSSQKKILSPKDGIPISILYYSQTGTSEDFSQRLAEEISSFGFAPDVIDVENYDTDNLENEKTVIFLASTYGEGDPPDNAADFHRWLMDPTRSEGELSGVKYAVFGLGNKTYDKFNQVGKEINRRLEELGANRIHPLGLGDDDVNIEKDFLSWKKEFSVALCKEFGLSAPGSGPAAPVTRRQRLVTYKGDDKLLEGLDVNNTSRWTETKRTGTTPPDVKNPYLAQIVNTKDLHTTKSERSCLHVEISTHGDILSYLPGDHIAIFPENDTTMVHKLAAQLNADLNQIISLHAIDDPSPNNYIVGPCTLKAALLQYYDISSVVRKPQLRVLSQYASDAEEKKRLEQLSSEDPDLQDLYDEYIVKACRCVSEILKEFKSISAPLDHFLEVLPKLQPRYYSISSSPNIHPNTVHITAVVVDYVTPTKREVKGVATNWLSLHRADPANNNFPRVPVFIRRSNFKLPSSPSTPVIMVGPGTGLAPFRGFIQEISYRRSKNPNQVGGMLFFGCRHPDKDFIYKEELQGHLEKGDLQHLLVAFSRFQTEKVYVQHKMLEGDMPDVLWKLLDSGACFYVCGDARLMARDVADSLLKIVMEKGQKSRSEAQKYIDDLQKDNRYLQDVWS